MSEKKREVHGYEIFQEWQINRRNIILGYKDGDDHPYLVAYENTGDFMTSYENAVACTNYFEVVEEYAKRLQESVSVLKEVQTLHGITDTLTMEDCIPDSRFADYHEKLMIVNPAVLSHECRIANCQLVRAESGFGCSASGSGRKVYGTKSTFRRKRRV